jgi:hypothetical protein
MTSEVSPDERAKATNRRRRHELSAAWLERANDEELMGLLSSSQLLQVGHAEVHLPQSAGRVFVKLLPITALELASRNRDTTANRFGLPTYYQYRIGSCGFGAWRELEVHRAANEWVLSGQCVRFPLLHHWRILPVVSTGYDDRRELGPWGDCRAISERVSAINDATSSVVLFLEYFPTTLGAQLRQQLPTLSNPAASVAEIEGGLKVLLAFVHARGVLHLDAHLENLLSDGSQVYLADYGLAVSRGFELSPAEERFFEAHQNFDLCTVINSLVHALVTYYDSRADWRQTLREVEAGTHGTVAAAPDGVRAYLVKRAPLALAVGEFYGRLLADPTTPYPAAAFDALLAGVMA